MSKAPSMEKFLEEDEEIDRRGWVNWSKKDKENDGKIDWRGWRMCPLRLSPKLVERGFVWVFYYFGCVKVNF
jgi:hypothetical protein